MKTATETKTRAKCHFISNTHWDREWRYSMQRTRWMLVHMIDMLLDIFEKEPGFKSFHMDSQTIPLEDYLEIRPERRELMMQLVREKRFLVGPWYVLPDEFCVGGEAIIRNLLLGHRMAREFGHVSKTGYSPFSWGQISQMPQIYSGFGIPFAAFYRGINRDAAPQSEFHWESPDGTRIVGSRLSKRPRYNVFYILQRPVFWGFENENLRRVRWSGGHGIARVVSDAYGETDAQYTHPRHEYHAAEVARRAQQTMREQDADWTTPHRFWSAGHDSSSPDAREVRLIADCAAALAEEADVFHSTVEDFQKCVVAEVVPDLPVLRGEMRYYRNNMEDSPLYAWITSARMDLKMENFRTERLLGQVAEPLAVFASLNGAPWPGGFVDEAWHWLLQNHGHDSIGGCSREVVPLDMQYRYRQSREIATCVLERAALDLAGSIDLSAHPADSVAVVAYNPSPLAGHYAAEVTVDIPQEWKQRDFELVDADGKAVPLQMRGRDTGRYTVVQAPNEAANMYECDRVKALALFPGLPSMGYRTFFVRPLAKATKKKVESLVTAPDAMENEHLRVRVCPNGTLEVTDKASGRVYRRVGYFHDSSEIGNPWERVQVPQEEILTTLNETPRISLVHDGDLEAAFRIEHDWELPAGRNADEKTRSRQRVACQLSTLVSLRRGQRWVEFVTDLDNRAEDHYLQVCFPTGVQTPVVNVQTPFDVVPRPVAMPDPAPFAETPMSEQPMDGFVDRSDGRHGVALMVEGMKAYTAQDDAEGTLSLTLLRSFPLRICITNLEVTDYSKVDRASQCLGQHRFRYAFLPHAGDWCAGGVWNDTVRFHSIPVVAQIAPSAEGTEPLEKSFLEIEPATVHVSAVKRAENGHGWVVRLFNPLNEKIAGRVRLNGGTCCSVPVPSPVERARANGRLPADQRRPWAGARLLTLEELPAGDLQPDGAGWAGVDLPPKKIVTVEFLPAVVS